MTVQSLVGTRLMLWLCIHVDTRQRGSQRIAEWNLETIEGLPILQSDHCIHCHIRQVKITPALVGLFSPRSGFSVASFQKEEFPTSHMMSVLSVTIIISNVSGYSSLFVACMPPIEHSLTSIHASVLLYITFHACHNAINARNSCIHLVMYVCTCGHHNERRCIHVLDLITLREHWASYTHLLSVNYQ